MVGLAACRSSLAGFLPPSWLPNSTIVNRQSRVICYLPPSWVIFSRGSLRSCRPGAAHMLPLNMGKLGSFPLGGDIVTLRNRTEEKMAKWLECPGLRWVRIRAGKSVIKAPLSLWSFWDASDLCGTLRSKVMSIFWKIFHRWHDATGMSLTWGREWGILLHYNNYFAKRLNCKTEVAFSAFPTIQL